MKCTVSQVFVAQSDRYQARNQGDGGRSPA